MHCYTLVHFEVDAQQRLQCVGYHLASAHRPIPLKTMVKQQRIRGLATYVLLPGDDYTHYCVPKPNMTTVAIHAALPQITAAHVPQFDRDACLMTACDVPTLLADDTAQLHVFMARESQIAGYVRTIRSAGLALQSITVHTMAMARLFALPAYSKLSVYINRNSGTVPSAQIFYQGAFVATKTLPNIVPECDVTIFRDQCTLFAQACQTLIQPYEHTLGCQAGVYLGDQLAFLCDQSTMPGQVFNACYPFAQPMVIQGEGQLPTRVHDATLIAQLEPVLFGGGLMYA